MVFFQITPDISEIENHYREIEKIRRGKPFKFLVVNTGDNVSHFYRTNLKIMNIKFPCETYKREWWLKKYYAAPYGREFEMKIVNFFGNYI